MATAASTALCSTGCALLPSPMPRDPPPLHDMEEPLEFLAEPPDEGERGTLQVGSFTGIYVADARASLDEMLGEPEGLLVARVVENSPADRAGIAEGDLLLAADGRALRWPSDWRELEVETAPGATLRLVFDRAGVEEAVSLVTEARVRPPAREETERFREELRAGVVLRTASEVEARAAGLGPGGGAVIVGLARASPWRTDGLRFGDLIHTVNGERVAHPEVVLDAIRRAPDPELRLGVRRGDSDLAIDAHLTRREQELKRVKIPLLFAYENDRGLRTTSVLFGLFGRKKSAAAWEVRLLWFVTFRGGDADRLREVGS